ncbi:MAG TPA: Hint domain-containing protein [Acidocella sp.]|nr:Hint domain-containing protein [Acidocella sp.]HQU04856.1 Hint domain-containing protein [Acidocella sp.]
MTTRIDILAPATITLLGSLANAVDSAPFSLSDQSGGIITVTLFAGNKAALLSASSAAGATISSSAGQLSITGNLAQVNAALSSLMLTDTGPDTLAISVADQAGLTAATNIAVNVISTAGPAFVAPPARLTISSYQPTLLAGLVLADPAAAALATAGCGTSETMQVSLSAASGILLLPGLTPLSGIAATGVGSNSVLLTFTADQLGAVNTLLAGLEWAGPAAISGLAYAARDVAGPLGATITSGNITLDILGTQGPTATVTSGADTAILGVSSLSAGSTLLVSQITSDVGGIGGTGAVIIQPDAALQVPYNQLSLGGTSYDFGTLAAGGLTEAGNLMIAGQALISGAVALAANALLNVDGSFIAGGGITSDLVPVLSLASGAMITDSGELVAGNFSYSGLINGPGTILAGTGDTLVIAAGAVVGSSLQVAAGGVLELGPLDPLYGLFNATALSVASNVTISFGADSGATPINGQFADTLNQSGGVIVLNSPQDFAGSIANFAPGDRLVFPGLSGLTLLNITANHFEVAGTDSGGVTQYYTIAAAIPSGMSLFVSSDAAGNGEVSLRDVTADIFLGGSTAALAGITAMPGIAQPVQGLDVLLRSWTGQTLSLTLSVAHGQLSLPGGPQAASLTINAASPTVLNTDLASLLYTASTMASFDALSISSNSALLSGASQNVPITLSNVAGTLANNFGDAGQASVFTGNQLNPLQGQAAPGEIIVTGSQTFNDALIVNGLSGTALLVNGGGTAIFDHGANVALGASAIIGNSGSSGTLDMLSPQFSMSGDLNITNGSLNDLGAITTTGSVQLGSANAAIMGSLTASAVRISSAGIMVLEKTAQASLGSLNNTGIFNMFDTATATVVSLLDGGTVAIGGTADLNVTGTMIEAGAVIIGPDAQLNAAAFSQTSGALSLAGTLMVTASLLASNTLDLAGGTLITPSLTLTSAALLTGAGLVGGAGTLGSITVSGGEILASGVLALDADISLSNNAGILIGTSAALDLAHAVSGGSIAFTGGSAELTINDVAYFQTPITNMLDHDAIDLIGVAPSLVSYAGGTIIAGTLGSFALSVAAAQPAVQLISDGHGGTLITLGGDMPCFARGTRLLTPNGYKPVEAFSPRDPIITLEGAKRPVRWIGRRTLDLSSHQHALPVQFAAGSIAPGIPARPVILSPLHAVFLEGVLVPACHLVNGATITVQKTAAVTYYHLELDRHDILLAEGMAAESYLDTGNRGQLYHEVGKRGTARTPCAALVTSGPVLARIRRKLHQRALQAGYTLTYESGLRGVWGPNSVMPRHSQRGQRRVTFKLPGTFEHLGLAARAATPADTDPDSEDRRQLGICLAGLPDGAKLGLGWYPRAAGDAGIWMGGAGALHLGVTPPRTLTLAIAAIIQSWVPPSPRPTH